jgi:glutaconate CoA-transferase subunit A
MLTSLGALACHISDGDVLLLPYTFGAPFSGAAMEMTRELVRRGVRGLHLIGVPALTWQADLLIGAGCVAVVEAGSILLYEHGPANRFVAAQRRAEIEVRDSTCPAIYAALIAAEKGLPFLPVRGLIGSDLLRLHEKIGDWRVIQNPHAEGAAADPIVTARAIRANAALFHAPLGDRYGNVWVGRRTELATMAHAATKALVTVEQVVDYDLMDDDRFSSSTIPSIYITALTHQPRGSWPLNCGPDHPEDAANLREYVRLAATEEGFAKYLADYVAVGRAAAAE